MKTYWIKRGIGIAVAVVAGIFLLGYVTMHLWNWLMPELFTGAQPIDYWHAIGILVLSKILFGGFKGKRGCGCGHRGHWRGRWSEKWMNMSEEEREKIKKWCGPDAWHTEKENTEKK